MQQNFSSDFSKLAWQTYENTKDINFLRLYLNVEYAPENIQTLKEEQEQVL